MRKFINFVALAALLFVPSLAMAQGTDCSQAVVVTSSTPFTEGFESGSMPSCWAQTGSSSSYSWSVATGDYSTATGAHTGTYNVMITIGSYSGDKTLITPLLDLSALSTGQLTFWHVQRAWGSDVDELIVKYRTSETGDWTVLETYTSAYSTWTEETILLPNTNATYQIAFEMNTHYGYGVGIDDIVIGAPPTCLPVTNLTASGVTSDGLTLGWTDAMNTDASYSIDYWKNGGDTTTVTSTTTSYTFSGLDANTNYHFSVKAVCTAEDASTSLEGSFRTACGGSACDLTLQLGASNSYWSPWTNGAKIQLWQDNELVGAYSTSGPVEVCGTSPIVVKYSGASSSFYDNYATITILDGGGVTVYSGGSGDTLCTITTPCPSCIPPTALVATPTTDEITFSWTPRSDASQFIVYLGDSLVDDNVTDTFFTFTDLTANTAYVPRVQAVCTTDDSSSIASINVRTECGTISLPFFEDFANYSYGAFPPCWHRVKAHGGDPSVNTELSGLNGSMYMFLQISGDTNLFVSPSAVPLSGDDIFVRYKAFINTASAYIKAGVMTNYNDMSTFVMLDSVGGYNFNNTFEEREFNTATLNASDSYYIAWLFVGAGYALGAVDDITITEIPACSRVNGIALESVDSISATLSWIDHANTGTTYTVSYWKEGTTDTLTANASDTSVVLSDLDANTVYKLFVVADCGSEPSNIFSFRTECGPITLPFSDNFDSYANGYWPPCWHRLRAHGTDPSVNAQFHHSAPQSMFLLAINDTTLFCTPSAVPTTGNNIYVRYQAYMQWSSSYNETKWIKAGVMTDTSDMSTFIALDSVGYHNFNNVYEEREFNTANLDPAATYWVAWMYYSTNNSYGYYNRGSIDDVYISEIPSCLRVSDIAAATITADTIVLTWLDNVNNNVSYTVNYWTATSDTTEVTATDTFYVFDDLVANTLYYFSVVANCGSEDAEAVTASFRTACGATPIPFSEGFEDASALACWQKVNCESETGRTTGSAATGDACFSFHWSANPPQYLISPELSNTDNGVKVEFQYKEYSTSYPETFKVGYSTTNNVPAAFTWGNEISATISYQTFSAIYPAGTKYVAIQCTSNDQYYLYIDDINFMLPPSCMPVSALYADDITASGATLHWTAPEGATDFYLKVDTNDAIPVSDNSYTLSTLDARTTYTVSVATDCNGDTSEWVSTTFTTDCLNGSCDIVISMVDHDIYSWGASAGGRVATYQNGQLVKYSSLTSYATSGVDSVNVCSGMPVTFRWASGDNTSWASDWASDCAFTIYDGAGTEIYSCNSAAGLDSLTTVANACPSCLTPTGVRAIALDSNEITFAWTENPNVAEYLISFNGEAYTNGFNGSETVTGLTPNTAYTFSVRAVCVSGVDTSAARTITAKTTCGQMVLPFVESFEADATGIAPSCWNVISGSPAVAAANSHTGSKSLTVSSNSMIATSLVPLAGDSIYVGFWANHSGGILEVGVMTDITNASTFIPLATSNGTGSNYVHLEFNTDTLPHDSSYYVAFRNYNSIYAIYVDDINIRQNDGCMYPTNLTANAVSNGADLSWSYSGTIGSFAVEYRTANGTWSTPDVVTATIATLSSLAASTVYEARVGTICGNDTLWTNAVAFTTSCAPQPVPYSEDFESYAQDVMPPCWSYADPNGITHWDGGCFFRGTGNYTTYLTGPANYAVLPELDGEIAKLKIEFDVKVGTIAEGDGLLIGVADAGGTLIAWLDTLQDPNFSRNQPVRKTIYFPNYNVPRNASRVAFAQYRSWSEWALIDNINIEVLPSCYPVDNIVGHNLIDPEATNFTWHPVGDETQWQVYVDTVTVDIDALANMPASNFTTVYDTTYDIPVGAIQGGGIYNFFVRANCGSEQSSWMKCEFGAGTVIMRNNTMADTVVGCGFVVYDNGGPVAGYLAGSNSTLVIRSADAGNQLKVFGGKFGFGDDMATLTIYDGVGTGGTVLYTYNTIGGRDTLLNTNLATSTTGALTITFISSGTRCHTGYELYVRCTGTASCPRPTELQATMTSETTADVTWSGTASNYNFYYRLRGTTAWTRQNVATNSISLTGLVTDTVYDMYVVALCSATDSSSASVTRQINTHYGAPVTPCHAPTALTVSDITDNSAVLSWTAGSTETAWRLEVNGTLVNNVTTNPYTLTGLTATTAYTVKVKAVCDDTHESEWSNAIMFTTTEVGIDNVYGSHITLFPNPASATVTLTGIEGQATVSVVDMNGRVSGEWRVESGKLTIDVSGFAQGAYFVRITGEQNTAIRKLIVK